MSRIKGIVLYSGGLDSILAAKILMEQEIEITGLYCILPYYAPHMNPEELDSSRLAEKNGLKLIFHRCGKEYIKMLKNPPHGYGKHINPCIDCKLFFMQKAADLMNQMNAEFVATGEVVGQRPMSQQKNTMIHIEKISGLKGRLLRPLSAKILEPTIPELEGKIDRNSLLDISGRGRKRQMELAKLYGIDDYSAPAGGCLFTDKSYSIRVRDLFEFQKEITETDLYLLTIGRHLRINKNLKIIVARNEKESIELEKLILPGDSVIRPEFKGPSVYVKGIMDDKNINIILSIISRYGKPAVGEDTVSIFSFDKTSKEIKTVAAIEDDKLNTMRI
ncbi:MAG TPA: hypothetical protein PK358_00390 [Spirochaetota bacterium]|nr:hypothetical protein [Spirochaetota bacterium]HPJ33259.1 hypothetical protein [Spirochaetota bacterium]